MILDTDSLCFIFKSPDKKVIHDETPLKRFLKGKDAKIQIL